MQPAERFDPRTGLRMPWFTEGALDEVAGWDLAGKVVLEWGGGYSTRWWASRAERVYTVESDRSWYQEIAGWGLSNVAVELRDGGSSGEYARVPDGCRPDVVVIDGDHRSACLDSAMTLPRPITIVFDNWQQDYVYLDPEAAERMRPYPGRFHVQPDHWDHEGRPWQTAIWYIGG